MKKVLVFVVVVIVVGGVVWYVLDTKEVVEEEVVGEEGDVATTTEDDNEPEEIGQEERVAVEVAAQGLEIPWDIAFLPQGGFIATERPGRLLYRKENGETEELALDLTHPVAHRGEAGLLGITLHPEFERNNLVYLYVTHEVSGGLINRVVRTPFEDGSMGEIEVLIDDIPGANFHDGGRIEFGPDGKLYITTGDAQDLSLPQDITSLSGKVLRLNDDGSIPADNPFDNEVYSYGHRNPQGLTWDDEERLWLTEHGPSGFDEINLIEEGGNYGWPRWSGTTIHDASITVSEEDHIPPRLHSGSRRVDTWAPASAAYHNGRLYFGGLRGAALFSAALSDGEVTDLDEHFSDEYGRVRTVRVGPDGYLYLTTSNRDGRGSPEESDDRIIKVDPEQL